VPEANEYQIKGEPFKATLNGWVREPWDFNGQTGTYLQLSVTKVGSMDSQRVTAVKELDEKTFPANGSVVEILPVFEKVFGESKYKLKALELRAVKAGASA
jgi:hypothetical protein